MDPKDGFGVTKDDHLSIYGTDMVDLCRRYGTPLFVFDERRLRQNYQRFRNAFEKHYPNTIVCYSIKTNNNLAICNIMREEGAYAEVGSGLDLHVAIKAGFPPEHIIYDGLFKPEDVLREAVKHKVSMINVESFSELKLLNKIAGELGNGRKQSVGIRVSTFTHRRFDPEQIYCNPQSRFGFSMEDALEAFKQAKKMENLEVKGIMTHPYWGIFQFLPLVKRIQEELKFTLQFINFGGGFEKPGTKKMTIMDLARDYLRQKLGLASNLDSPSKKKIREVEESGRLTVAEVRKTLGNTEATLVFEPGRYLIHDAGYLLLRVGVIKKAGGFKWVVVDGGCNLNSDWLERRRIKLVNHVSKEPEELVNIVGPLLFARDFVAVKQRLPKIERGDILAISNSGAYTLSNSTQFLSPRPSAVLVRQDGAAVEIREKETYDDVIRMDKI